MQYNCYDVVIVGSGAAGLYGALNLPDDVRILMTAKQADTLSNSSLAQGGVAAVLSFDNDSFDRHEEDTFIAGGRENSPEAVHVLVREGPDDVRRIMEMGVDFDRDANGELEKTLEGGHSRRRIVYHADQTGYEIVTKLLAQVRQKPNIDYEENCMVCNMERIKGGFALDILNSEDRPVKVYASYVLLASGGVGRVYQYTTNSAIATGDGIRIAYNMGARIKHLSYIQFHPTAFAAEAERERFLISESVRGEGAYLLNGDQERFMRRYDERLELAPRDVVSRSIMLEERRTGSKKFYLDIRYKGKEFLTHRFPAIYGKCLEEGIDLSTDLIPVYPCQHYLMGGIDVDLNARTSVPRLYAAGECSHTGVHGHNRLASNSLLEALVFSRRAAQDIRRCMEAGFSRVSPGKETSFSVSGAPLPTGLRTEIRKIMQEAYFVIPNARKLHEGKQRIEQLLTRLQTGGFALTRSYCECLSLATVAAIILREVDKA